MYNGTLMPPVPQLMGSCTGRAARYRATLAANLASERPASNAASLEVARVIIPPTPRTSFLVPYVTTPPYSATVSPPLQQMLRGEVLLKKLYKSMLFARDREGGGGPEDVEMGASTRTT